MLPLPNSKTNKNTGQNCSTYSFTITKRILKRQDIIGTQRQVFFQKTRPMPASEHGSRRNRIWGQIRSYLGADATESGSRDERVWEQMRPRLPPRSLTGIGGREKDMGAQEADCNAGKKGLGHRRSNIRFWK